MSWGQRGPWEPLFEDTEDRGWTRKGLDTDSGLRAAPGFLRGPGRGTCNPPWGLSFPFVQGRNLVVPRDPERHELH